MDADSDSDDDEADEGQGGRSAKGGALPHLDKMDDIDWDALAAFEAMEQQVL